MSTKRIALDLELVQAAEVAAKLQGLKTHHIIEDAIRSRLDGVVDTSASLQAARREELLERGSKSSTPPQIGATLIANNSEKKSTATWCRYAKNGQHTMIRVDTGEGYTRCDVCYYEEGSTIATGDCWQDLDHTFAEVHGYNTNNRDRIRCIDLCTRCELKRDREGCEVWSWCVLPERWAEIVEARAVAARKIYDNT